MEQAARSAPEETATPAPGPGGPSNPEPRRLTLVPGIPPGVPHLQQQARWRLVAAGLACAATLVAVLLGQDPGLLPIVIAYLVCSGLILVLSRRARSGVAWAAYPALLVDVGTLSVLAALHAEATLPVYPVLLLLTTDHAVRQRGAVATLAPLAAALGYAVATASQGWITQTPLTWLALVAGLLLFPAYLVLLTRDAFDRAAALRVQRDAAEHRAAHDELTGLPNRATLLSRLHQALARARRGDSELTLVLVDIDGFGEVNAVGGRTAGDRLLCRVGAALVAAVRDSDTVARIGTDQFVVVFDDTDRGPGAELLIQRLASRIAAIADGDDGSAPVSCGFGVVVHPRNGDDVTQLLDRAETALRAAKSRGAGCFAFYDAAMSARVEQRLALADALRTATERGEMALDFQPIIDTRSGRVRAAEALLRWNHPRLGRLPAKRFLDVAERNGLIVPIGDWVLRQAIDAAVAWRRHVDIGVSMHVNVSARQLEDDDFVTRLAALLRATGLPAETLVLEIAEPAWSGPWAARAQLDALRGLGVRVALDRLGSGTSTLALLKDLPVDAIKLDRSLIDRVPAAHADCALVDAVLTLGERLDRVVFATGIETDAQREWLIMHGCRYLQGHLLGAPVALNALLAMSGQVFDTAPSTRSG